MKKMKLLSAGILLAFTALTLTNCGGDKEEAIDNPPPKNPCEDVAAKFTANVLPLIQEKCEGCHKPGGGAAFAPLTNYDEIKARASKIKALAVDSDAMPKTGAKLTASQKSILSCWISSGTPNN